MSPLCCAMCAVPCPPQCYHMTFGSPCILSHFLLLFAPIFVIFPYPTVTPFISLPPHVLLWLRKRWSSKEEAGSELQAYQLMGQPLHLSRDEEQVLEEFSISGALMLLSNAVAADQATKGVMAEQSDCSPEQ